MTGPVARIAPAARQDLNDQADWFGAEADVDTARRFARSAAETFTKLASSPGLGSPVEIARPELRGLRKWRVQGFPKLLIFYVALADGVRIVRVIHAAQDWMTRLRME